MNKIRGQGPIVVIDSGVGGLSIAEHLIRYRPGENYVYLADNHWFPYGLKDPDQLKHRVVRIIRHAWKFYKARAIVVACNTASTLFDADHFDLPCPVYLVKPDLASALEAVGDTGSTAVLGTPSTLARLPNLQGRQDLLMIPSMPLVHLAQQYVRRDEIDAADEVAALRELPITVTVAGQIGVVVLGCTHFPLVRESLQLLFTTAHTWIDPGQRVAFDVVRRIPHTRAETVGSTQVVTTRHDLDLAKGIARRMRSAAATGAASLPTSTKLGA